MTAFARQILPALLLGGCGFALNTLELQLGWGMHFIFGNALVFAFLRILPPPALILAASISSAWSIFLWNHPWAWIIWTIEAAAVALFVNRTSPVRSDLIFWLLLGTPLLVGSYGAIMQMDDLSLSLVIAKQAINGILNVALGELFYTVALTVLVRHSGQQVVRLPIESYVLMATVTTILIPTMLFLALDADSREDNARSAAAQILEDELLLTATAIDLWQTSRGEMLNAFARQQTNAPGPTTTLPIELGAEFSRIELISASGSRVWSVGMAGSPPSEALHPSQLQTSNRPDAARIVVAEGVQGASSFRLYLIAPLSAQISAPRVIATLRPTTIHQLINRLNITNADAFMLASPGVRRVPLQLKDPDFPDILAVPDDRTIAARSAAVLISSTGYGNALMSDLKNATVLRAIPLPGMPGWDVVGMTRLNRAVLAARQEQFELLLMLSALIVLVTIVGSTLAKRIELSLRALAQSAADLAMSGTTRTTIDNLVIRELSDISINIATVGSTVARERGALIGYQRRLRSITRHAPVVVYALDVNHRDKTSLHYVSEAIERLLGYTQQEASSPGWWASAVHPDDYPHCLAAFSALRAGHSISEEYRLKHKQGHYVWVYDTLALEQGPEVGRAEAVGLLLDVSDRRRATEQLIQADKMSSLGRMVAGIAHELNQPLNFIKVAVNNLRERTKRGQFDHDLFAKKFETILANVGRASAIMLQMRVFGRTPTESIGPILVKDAVDELSTLLRPQFEIDGVKFDTSDCDPKLTVNALPVLLEQVLLNLLLNARDALQTQPISQRSAPGQIVLSAYREGSRAIITVRDNGPGVPENLLPMLFEPFFTTKPPQQGTGLGLSISYGIIRDLGGTIHAANGERGARFTIDLPLSL